MKLTRVEFLQSNYDPRTDKGPPYGGSLTMLASDGYTLDLADGIIRIGHSGRAAVYPFGTARYALEEPPKPPEPEQAKPEEPQVKGQLQPTRLVEPRDLPLVVSAKTTTDADMAERRAERASLERVEPKTYFADRAAGKFTAQPAPPADTAKPKAAVNQPPRAQPQQQPPPPVRRR